MRKKGSSKVEWTSSKFLNYLVPRAELGQGHLSPDIVFCLVSLLSTLSYCRTEKIEQRGAERRMVFTWHFTLPQWNQNSECRSAGRKHCLPIKNIVQMFFQSTVGFWCAFHFLSFPFASGRAVIDQPGQSWAVLAKVKSSVNQTARDQN